MQEEIHGPVLLVCIYNKFGNIITHDYFYQLFGQYGEIVKILIFQKAKVWKTFVEFSNVQCARVAMHHLNGHIVFEDGSKMNIFSSKLQHIQFANANLGGVNYGQLKDEQNTCHDSCEGIRTRSSTCQEKPHFSWGFPDGNDLHASNKGSTGEQHSTFYSNKKSDRSYNTFDIDQQFLEIARQSEQFRLLQKTELSNRRKSKTIVTNPNLEQFVLENSPSKVVFARSIPQEYTNKCLYNIFRNFGNVLRVIHMKDKASGLIEFETIEAAICAKDELNYVKSEMKIFYSHYETLSLRKQVEGEEFEEYQKSINSKLNNINPPSQILYLTMANPSMEPEVRQIFEELGCPILNIDWRPNGKDKWMCLADIGCIEKSLKAMGFLQGIKLSNGKQLKLSFTRSKIAGKRPAEGKLNSHNNC